MFFSKQFFKKINKKQHILRAPYQTFHQSSDWTMYFDYCIYFGFLPLPGSQEEARWENKKKKKTLSTTAILFVRQSDRILSASKGFWNRIFKEKKKSMSTDFNYLNHCFIFILCRNGSFYGY